MIHNGWSRFQDSSRSCRFHIGANWGIVDWVSDRRLNVRFSDWEIGIDFVSTSSCCEHIVSLNWWSLNLLIPIIVRRFHQRWGRHDDSILLVRRAWILEGACCCSHYSWVVARTHSKCVWSTPRIVVCSHRWDRQFLNSLTARSWTNVTSNIAFRRCQDCPTLVHRDDSTISAIPPQLSAWSQNVSLARRDYSLLNNWVRQGGIRSSGQVHRILHWRRRILDHMTFWSSDSVTNACVSRNNSVYGLIVHSSNSIRSMLRG
jgi:hypothetical protein